MHPEDMVELKVTLASVKLGITKFLNDHNHEVQRWVEAALSPEHVKLLILQSVQRELKSIVDIAVSRAMHDPAVRDKMQEAVQPLVVAAVRKAIKERER